MRRANVWLEMPCFFCFLFYIKRVLAKGQQEYVKKKSRLSPIPVKRTVGEIEARDGGAVTIRDVLTLLCALI